MRFALICLCLLAAAAAAADRRPNWSAIEGVSGLVRLGDTRVWAVLTDDAPLAPANRICVEAPSLDAPWECPQAHDGKFFHLWVDTDTAEGREILDSAKLAVAAGKYVTLFVDPADVRLNHRGVPRCKVVRLVVTEAE